MEKSEVALAREAQKKAGYRLIDALSKVEDLSLRDMLIDASFDYAKSTANTAFLSAKALVEGKP